MIESEKNMDKNNNKKEAVVVFAAWKARELIRRGYHVIDIKPDRDDPTGARTLFLFDKTDEIMHQLSEIQLCPKNS